MSFHIYTKEEMTKVREQFQALPPEEQERIREKLRLGREESRNLLSDWQSFVREQRKKLWGSHD